jgi:hypothetical protein
MDVSKHQFFRILRKNLITVVTDILLFCPLFSLYFLFRETWPMLCGG